MIRPEVHVVRRVPSAVIVGGAWLRLRVRLQCGICRMQDDFTVERWGEASELRETIAEVRDERDAGAAWDAIARALAAGWALTSDSDLRCFVCRRAEDCGAVRVRRAA